MKGKKWMSLMIAGVMMGTVLSGCGKVSSETDSGADVSGVEEENSAESQEAASEFEGFDTMQSIDMYGMSMFGEDGLQEVMDEINAISEKEINVHVTYHPLDVSSYIQQIALMLSGGEPFDLTMVTSVPVVSFATKTAQNVFGGNTGYLDEYAPELKEKLGDYLDATVLNDSVYAVPCYKQYNSSLYIFMREDILDELGLTEQARKIQSWSDYEEIMLAVKEAQDSGKLPDDMRVNCMICNADAQGAVIHSGYCNVGADNFADTYGYDGLGDSNRIVYVDENGKVGNYFATEDYRATVERINKWYQEGLVYKDAATSQDAADGLMMNDVTFSYVGQAEYGAEYVKEMQTGKNLVAVKILDIPIQTANGNSWGWAVPTTSENPEAAVAFLNLMYNNKEIENLFVYGIEGRDYEINGEGEAALLENGLYQSSDFFFGNQFLAYPSAGNGGDFREESLADMKAAEMSPYYGCVISTDPIANEITALTAVLKKYEPALESGVADVSTLDAMLTEMEANGLQKVLDSYQEQLDAWIAEQ